MVFDLDPGAPADIVQCCQVGLWLREFTRRNETESVCQNYRLERSASLRAAQHAGHFRSDERASRALSPNISKREHPNLVVSKMSKALRKGKVFVDWSQNDEHKTTISVYSSARQGRADCLHSGHLGRGRRDCLKKKKAIR